MKIHKRYSTAMRDAAGTPMLRVGRADAVYVTDVDDLTEVSIIDAHGHITGFVILKHLDRLGNANHAVRVDPYAKAAQAAHAFEQPPSDRIGLSLDKGEALALMALLAQVEAAGQLTAQLRSVAVKLSNGAR